MKKPSQISSAVIKRLPRYRRFIKELMKDGVDRVSSSRLSELTGYTASQIRQDFNNFGGFGQQGYGYNVRDLYDSFTEILGLDTDRHMVIVGASDLGRALVTFPWSQRASYILDGIFDNSPEFIGKKVGDFTIRSYGELKTFLKESPPDVGVITTSQNDAEEAVGILVEGGTKGIWSFTPVNFVFPTGVPLQLVHLNDSLHELSYHIKKDENKK
jgi:redox-sensing transcriptional repressor